MLFGPVDRDITRYIEIENSYRNSLDSWLANLYFTLSQKDKLGNSNSAQLVLDEDTKNRHKIYEKIDENEQEENQILNTAKNQPKADQSDLSLTKEHTTGETSKNEITKNENSNGATSSLNIKYKSKKIIAERKQNIIEDILKSESSDSETDTENQISKSHNNKNLAEDLSKPEYYSSFSFNIPKTLETNIHFGHKITYLWEEAMSDLGFTNIATIEFWISLMILIVTLWIRQYLHIFGSWLFLLANKTPINKFTPMM